MKDKISIEELNKMAEIDGEMPFDSNSKDFGMVDENFVKAMEFTNSLKIEMSMGYANEEIPGDWIDMINDADLSLEKKSIQSKSKSSTELVPKIIKFLNPSQMIGDFIESLNPSYALGGVFACVLGIGLVFQSGIFSNGDLEIQSDVNGDSYFAYTETLVRGDSSGPQTTGDSYFFYTEPLVRGDSSGAQITNTSTGKIIYESLQNDLESLSSIDYESFAAIFLAMELDEKSIGNLKGETWELWASFLRKNTEDCFEVLISATLDDQAPGIFLNYCPKKWSEKVSFLKLQ